MPSCSVIGASQRGGRPVTRTNGICSSTAAPMAARLRALMRWWSSIRVPSMSLAISRGCLNLSSLGGGAWPRGAAVVAASATVGGLGVPPGAGGGLGRGVLGVHAVRLLQGGRPAAEGGRHPVFAGRMRAVVGAHLLELGGHRGLVGGGELLGGAGRGDRRAGADGDRGLGPAQVLRVPLGPHPL